jgi:hypothetical protein
MQSQSTQGTHLPMIVREHPKLRDLWPPEPGGAVTQGFQSPEGGADTLEQVLYYAPVGRAKANVALLTKYKSHAFTRDLQLDDAEFASRFATWLRSQIGHPISEIGETNIQNL